jgi:hypothetical protein
MGSGWKPEFASSASRIQRRLRSAQRQRRDVLCVEAHVLSGAYGSVQPGGLQHRARSRDDSGLAVEPRDEVAAKVVPVDRSEGDQDVREVGGREGQPGLRYLDGLSREPLDGLGGCLSHVEIVVLEHEFQQRNSVVPVEGSHELGSLFPCEVGHQAVAVLGELEDELLESHVRLHLRSVPANR